MGYFSHELQVVLGVASTEKHLSGQDTTGGALQG